MEKRLAIAERDPEGKRVAGAIDPFTSTFMNSEPRRDRDGPGLSTKIAQIPAEGLGIEASRIWLMPTRTGNIPNTSATAASASTDLKGAAALVAAAYRKRVPLFARSFYRTPGIQYDAGESDRENSPSLCVGRGGIEVEIDVFPGDCRVLRDDILAPVVDRGQIEGGFIHL
jgi:xanthine dehydrogenase molybdopterin-binding subunit B